MQNTFKGSCDPSAIIVTNVFPDSNLIISTPFKFESKRSGVYLEGKLDHLEAAFEYSKKLVDAYLDEAGCGRWIGISPPDDGLERLIIHYEALSQLDKLQLLNFLFPKQLAKVCDLCVSAVSSYVIKVDGKIIQTGNFFLPPYLTQGSKLLSDKFKNWRLEFSCENKTH
jgi:hypothetical protein